MRKKSIYNRFTPSVIIPIILLVILINVASFTILLQNEKRAAEMAADFNHLYVEETDKSLRAIEEYMFLIQLGEEALDTIKAEDEWTQLSAEIDIKRNLESTINAFPLVEYMFVYDQTSEKYIYVYNIGSTAQTRADMRSYLDETVLSGTDISFQWQAVTITDDSYLLRISERRGVLIGAWVRMSGIEKPLQKLSGDTDFVPVVTDAGMNPKSHRKFLEESRIELRESAEFYPTGKGNSYYVRTDRSETAPYCLCLILPRTFMSGLGGFLLITLLLVSLATFAFIPLLLRLIRKDVIEPLRALDTAITEIGSGNSLYQIPLRDDPEEFVRMDDAFNTMTMQLHKAKIQAVEDVIEKQKLRLSYLQMQIRPHFFLNALTTVSNFSRLGKQEELDRFIGYLASFLRYMFRSNLTLVPLKDEIDHIETYLSMQELRFIGTLNHVFDIPKEALQVMIPPFSIHNFVENIVKHAMSEQEYVTLYLQAQMEKDALHITAEDNGIGLSEENLLQMNDADYTPREGQSIGIWNTRHTLRLLYGGRADIVISRSLLGGAKVELIIPYQADERMASDEDSAV